MPEIAINFDQVPDKIPPIENGSYLLLIEKEPEMKENADKTGINLIVQMKIVSNIDGTETPMKDRMITDFIGLNSDPKSFGVVRAKNLITSAGIKAGAGGVPTGELVGKTVRAEIKQNVATSGKYVGETFANIKQYFWKQ